VSELGTEITEEEINAKWEDTTNEPTPTEMGF